MKSIATHLAIIAAVAVLVSGCTTPTTGGSSTNGANGNNGTTGGPPQTYPANPYAIPSSTTQVKGSGASFVKPLMEQWSYEFARAHSKVQVLYGSVGSGQGIKDITAKVVVFAGSDAPMNADERSKAAGILHIPETLGLVAVVYNGDELPDGLKLDGQTIGQIYAGDILKWNDQRIKDLNPGVSLPDKGIAIVHRTDSSGTTYVFTDFLTRTSEAWKAKFGAAPSKSPSWANSANSNRFSGAQNDGVASEVRRIPYSVGYVEYAYKKQLNFKAAMVKGGAGEFLAPTTDGAKKAAAGAAATLPAADADWSPVSISFSNVTGAYPISSFSYMMVYKSLGHYGGSASADQLNAFKAWLFWGLHQGQSYAEPLGYAPLPDEVVTKAEASIAMIQV